MLPEALAIGVPYKLFFHLSPKGLTSFHKAHKIKIISRDAEMWRNGQYTFSAVLTAVEHCLSGKKAKSEYISEPLLMKQMDEVVLTQEELDERELRKMLFAEEQWIKHSNKKGLPKTVIK